MIILFASLAWSTTGACACDHTLDLSTLSANGTDLGVLPGDTVCVAGGPREYLRLYDFVGTEADPVVVQNCDGQVDIDNPDRGYGLTLSGSSHVQITGTGDAAHAYGFKVRAARTGPDYAASCVIVSDLSTDVEVDHIEAYECGFAGVIAKTDPTCDDPDLRGFTMFNSRLHHLYLHNTGGEGIYFGSTGYPSRDVSCNGVTTPLYPHPHVGVWIHDNLIEDTGWDGAQVGVSTDCHVTGNRIARVGLEGVLYQWQGLQIGGGTSCHVTDNHLSDGPAIGIFVLGAGDMWVANNVVERFLDGIYLNDSAADVAVGASYEVVHNTVVDIEERGITIFGGSTVGNALVNNLLVQAGTAPLGIGNEVDATDAGNLALGALADALFVDATGGDLQLQAGSPAIDVGVDATPWGVTTDQNGGLRDALPDPGAFEFGAAPADTDTDADSDTDVVVPEEEAKGCGCTTSTGSAGWLGLLGLLLRR